MTKNKTLTLDEIANRHLRRSFLDGKTDQERENDGDTRLPIDEQIEYLDASLKQQFLQWVADTCIGDDSDTPNVMIAMEHNRQRQILRDNGYKTGEYDE